MLLDKLVGTVAAHRCFSCGAYGSVLCEPCRNAFVDTVPSRCAGCRKLSADYRTCAQCRRWLPLKHVYVATSYDGVGERLVHEMKFESRRQSIDPIVRQMSEVLQGRLTDSSILCPIPTAPSRVRERGFDHAVLMCKLLGKILERPSKLLLRRLNNSRQVGSTRIARLKQMEEAFCIGQESVLGRTVVLVDDVFTTGATLSSAAKILKHAGAREVSAVIFCQK